MTIDKSFNEAFKEVSSSLKRSPQAGDSVSFKHGATGKRVTGIYHGTESHPGGHKFAHITVGDNVHWVTPSRIIK
jgi:hypothetical protein